MICLARATPVTLQISEVKDSDGTVLKILDDSVFKNFKRLLKSQAEKCVSNDLRFWIGKDVIQNSADYKNTTSIILKEFKTIAELHHTISA